MTYRYVDATVFTWHPEDGEEYEYGGSTPDEVYYSYLAAMRSGGSLREYPDSESGGGMAIHDYASALVAPSGDYFYKVGFNRVVPTPGMRRRS